MTARLSASSSRFFVVASGLAVAAAVAVAAHDSRRAGMILGGASAAVDGLLDFGTAIRTLGDRLAAMRFAVVLVALSVLALRWRSAAYRPAGWIAAALGLAAAAQSYLLDEQPGIGLLLYAIAAAAVVLAPRHPAPERALRPAVERPAAIVLLALFVFGCLYALDLRPDLGWDEFGFTMAARMQLGDIPPGRVLIYRLARFQGEPVPLALHALALRTLDAGIVSVRLVSLAAGTVALTIAGLAVRQRLGAAVMLWMLALAAFTPLHLAYSRFAEYVIVSVPHAALTFAVALRLHDRPSWATAALLGGLVGGSLYFYQASWFVPLFVAGTFVAWPRWWRAPRAPAMAVLSLAVALATVAPGFTLLRDELAAVGEQSFDRAVWLKRPLGSDDRAVVIVMPPDRAAEARLEEVAGALGSHEVDATIVPLQEHRVLVLEGPRERVRAARDELPTWAQLRQMNLERWTAWDNIVDVLRRLFFQPSLDLTLIDVPILNPVVAPLLVLGLAEAVRGWRAPIMRALVVWTVGGAVLPSMVAGVFPRRMVLMLPFAYVLAALPVVALIRALCAYRWWGRIATVGLGAALFVAVVSTNAALYFRHWDWAGAQGGASKLRLLQVLETLPPDEVVILPKLFLSVTGEGVADYWRVLYPDRPARPLVVAPSNAPEAAEMRRLSCAQTTPFTWIVPTRSKQWAAAVAAVAGTYQHTTEARGPFVVVRMLGRAEGACR